jgi:hypothetical protein
MVRQPEAPCRIRLSVDALGDGPHDEVVPRRCVAVPGIDSVEQYTIAIAVGCAPDRPSRWPATVFEFAPSGTTPTLGSVVAHR